MSHTVKSTCCYCGVGCGVLIDVDAGNITGVRGDPAHPANQGRLCTKGASLHLTTGLDARLLHPARRDRTSGARQAVSWDVALDEAADRFADIIRHDGPDAVAFYVSGQLLTEDYYVFNKLAKGLIGTNNIDTNSRLCMSSAVAGYKRTLGADAPPCAYEDFAHADLFFISGANPAVAHPVAYRRIEEARAARPAARLIVVDPRRTETAAQADLHLAIRPGSDVALYNAMLHVLIAENRIDPDYIARHTEGFDALAAIARETTPALAADICGVPAEAIVTAARWFGAAGSALSLYCQGLNQSAHGTDNNAALIHLHLATGQIGRPGAGPFSLTGQPNAMGGREVGGLANLLSAHRDLANPAHRAEVARLWGIPEVPSAPGKGAVDLFRALQTGEIKAVWIACTNPAQSLPFQTAVRDGLGKAAYVVVQEAYARTDTTEYADLLLPAASWGEKSGTVTNSERRITRVQPAVTAPGEARPDWAIAVDFAHRLAARLGRDDAARLFPYETPEAVFNEHRESTRGRDLDITGLSYARLEAEGPQQWPFPEGASAGQARLYADGVFPTATGRARFVPVRHRGLAEMPDEAHPISLISGRLRDQWHGMSRTGTVPRLFNLDDEPLLAMHPDDLATHGLAEGDIAAVSNPRGRIAVRVTASDSLRPGTAWLPMHWGSQFMNSPGANALTPDVVDPASWQPELKHAAVAVSPLALPYPLAVLRRCADAADARRLLAAVRPLLAEFPYATLALQGSSASLVVFRAARATPFSAEELARIDALFEMAESASSIDYADPARHVSKKALAPAGRLQAVRLAGETLAQGWLKHAMAEDGLSPSLVRFALAATASAPARIAARHIVCKCADISDAEIRHACGTGADLEGLKQTLKCGTFCGGCVPDLKRMIAEYAAEEAATT